MNQNPDKIYIEEKVREHPLTQKILSKLPGVPVLSVNDYRQIGFDKSFSTRAAEDKNSLALAVKNGELVKNAGRMESGQFYLFHEMDCRYDCEYCYLQYYFQTKVPVIFVNRDGVLDRIEGILKSYEAPYFHVGEVCDALAFDELTEFSKDIIELFSKHDNGKIEFRTKSANIENLLSVQVPPRNLIPSWTFSPEIIACSIEHKTPSFSERLRAAKRCQREGYTVGVRIDPILRIEGWENEYTQMVEEILSVLDPRHIDYVSLGTPKHHKLLYEAIKKRFPESPAVLGEIFPTGDGKYRYLKFERVETYRKMVSRIRELDNNIKIELSLESEDVNTLVFDSHD